MPKRTPDGQPDLQGYWQWAGMSTGKEKRHLDVGLDAPDGSGLWAYAEGWRSDQHRQIHNNLPSGVIDPADGWLPLQPWAEHAKYDIVDHGSFPRSLADVDPHGRCLPSGVPRTNYAIRYAGYQFLQAPGYVMLYAELNHQPRIIPLDGRPHLNPRIKLFLGDSRGTWKDSTLTVRTKNQRVSKATGFGWLDMNATLYSDAIDVVEKYTIINEDIIAYETTVSDPKVMTRPWTMAGTFIRAVKDWEVLEFACHEGNHAIDNIRDSIDLRAKEKAQLTPPSLGGTPNQLSPEEFERLMSRTMGTWILNRAKSTIMSGDTLGVLDRYVYERTPDRKGVIFTRGNDPATTIQMYDGKPYGTPRSVARIPIDEFTIDNVTAENGRRVGHNTQMFSADGTKSIYMVRVVNEQGEETLISVVLFEKVPDGTPISKPPAPAPAKSK